MFVPPHVALLHELIDASFNLLRLHLKRLNHLNDLLHQVCVLYGRVFVSLHDFHYVGVHDCLALAVYALLHGLILGGCLFGLGQ